MSIIAISVAASSEFGMRKPRGMDTECVPRNTVLTRSEATTLSAIGPTSELERVVTPPVTMTSTSFDSSACTSSATGMELVRMVMPDDCCDSSRCCANTYAVVPPPMAITSPGATYLTASCAMASFRPMSICDFTENSGSLSSVLVLTAPPCTRFSRPLSARSAMSRRMVIAETPNSLDSAVMRTAPRVRRRLKIKCWRCDEII